LVPTREESFDGLCTLFDDLDAWLRTGKVATGIAWADAGLDIAFTDEFVGHFRQAVAGGPEVFGLPDDDQLPGRPGHEHGLVTARSFSGALERLSLIRSAPYRRP
jgi:hypothetical protein